MKPEVLENIMTYLQSLGIKNSFDVIVTAENDKLHAFNCSEVLYRTHGEHLGDYERGTIQEYLDCNFIHEDCLGSIDIITSNAAIMLNPDNHDKFAVFSWKVEKLNSLMNELEAFKNRILNRKNFDIIENLEKIGELFKGSIDLQLESFFGANPVNAVVKQLPEVSRAWFFQQIATQTSNGEKSEELFEVTRGSSAERNPKFIFLFGLYQVLGEVFTTNHHKKPQAINVPKGVADALSTWLNVDGGLLCKTVKQKRAYSEAEKEMIKTLNENYNNVSDVMKVVSNL